MWFQKFRPLWLADGPNLVRLLLEFLVYSQHVCLVFQGEQEPLHIKHTVTVLFQEVSITELHFDLKPQLNAQVSQQVQKIPMDFWNSSIPPLRVLTLRVMQAKLTSGLAERT